MDDVEHQLRVDLSAAFRLAARAGWHEAVANHFSAAVSADGKRFLVNPRWVHFSHIRASNLLLCKADDKETMNRPDAPDPSAWAIHSALHRNCPQARIVLHLHPTYATVIASLKDPEIKPIDQNTARFYNRIAIDRHFGGIATEVAEGERISKAVGNHGAVIMANHGVATFGATVAEAFDQMYYLERACTTLVKAYQTGQALNVMSAEIAEETAAGWDDYKGAQTAHFEELKRMLDREEPDYRE